MIYCTCMFCLWPPVQSNNPNGYINEAKRPRLCSPVFFWKQGNHLRSKQNSVSVHNMIIMLSSVMSLVKSACETGDGLVFSWAKFWQKEQCRALKVCRYLGFDLLNSSTGLWKPLPTVLLHSSVLTASSKLWKFMGHGYSRDVTTLLTTD